MNPRGRAKMVTALHTPTRVNLITTRLRGLRMCGGDPTTWLRPDERANQAYRGTDSQRARLALGGKQDNQFTPVRDSEGDASLRRSRGNRFLIRQSSDLAPSWALKIGGTKNG